MHDHEIFFCFLKTYGYKVFAISVGAKNPDTSIPGGGILVCICNTIFLGLYQVQRPSFVGVEGSVVELRVTVTGNPPPDVYWRKGPVRDIDTTRGRFRILRDGSLQVRMRSNICFLLLMK